MTDDELTLEAVQRYSPIVVAPHDVDPFGAMETDSDGGFVLYEDYTNIPRILAALENESFGLNDRKRQQLDDRLMKLEAENALLLDCVRWFASTKIPSSSETPVDCIQLGINRASALLRNIGDET